MHFTSFVTFISVLATVQCTADNLCLTPEPPAKLVAAHNMLKAQEVSARALMPRDNPPRLDIDLYMHVVESEQKKGDVKDDAIQKQVNIIVDTYSKYNIMFHYKGVDHTVNEEWGTTVNDTLGRGLALRKGDYLALNVYIVTSLGESALGICTFPRNSDKIPGIASEVGGDEVPDDASQFLPKDGCTIGGFTLPGQEYGGEAMEGLTAIHEIGHWLGLFHTFQGDDCDGPGDLIADTRPQTNSTQGCPEHRVSCPNIPFAPTPEDPIHNFMDYSADNCTTEFTPLQMVRVFGVFPIFRVAQNSNASTTGNYNSSTSGNCSTSTPGNSNLSTTIPVQTNLLPNSSNILAQVTSTNTVTASGTDTSVPANLLPNPSDVITQGTSTNTYSASGKGTCVTNVVTITTLSC